MSVPPRNLEQGVVKVSARKVFVSSVFFVVKKRPGGNGIFATKNTKKHRVGGHAAYEASPWLFRIEILSGRR